MKTILVIILGMMPFYTNAQTTLSYTHEVYQEAQLPPLTPYNFIFSQDKTLLYAKNGVNRNLISVFNAKHTSEENLKLKNKILKLIPDEHDFSAYDFTFIIVSDESAEDYCPPCITQEKINKAILNKLSDKNIAYFKVVKIIPGSRTFEMLSTEEFQRRYGNTGG